MDSGVGVDVVRHTKRSNLYPFQSKYFLCKAVSHAFQNEIGRRSSYITFSRKCVSRAVTVAERTGRQHLEHSKLRNTYTESRICTGCRILSKSSCSEFIRSETGLILLLKQNSDCRKGENNQKFAPAALEYFEPSRKLPV